MDELIHSNFEIFQASAVLYVFCIHSCYLQRTVKEEIIQILVKGSKQDLI